MWERDGGRVREGESECGRERQIRGGKSECGRER